MYVDSYGFYCNHCEWTDDVQMSEEDDDESAA